MLLQCRARTLLYIATAMLIPWVLLACDGHSRAVSSETEASSVAFQLPERIRASQAINQQQVSAKIIIGNREVSLSRNGDTFTGSIDVTSGTMLSFVLQISEQSSAQNIILATLNNTRLITNDTNITLQANQYTYPDTDSDGFNNLTEREAGSDHANSNSTPDNPDGQNGNSPTELNPGILQFSADTYTVSEADGSLEITVNRVGGSDGRVSVNYSLNSETAIRDQDFQSATGELVWEDGETTPRTITATVLADNDFEGDQTFTAHLFSASNGGAVGNGFARINLQDSTAPPQRGTIQWAINTIQVTEAASTVVVTLERVGGNDGLVTVDYNTADLTATGGEDYAAVGPRTLAWADGDSSDKEISIQILNDELIEPNETFSIVLSSVRGGATLGTAEIIISIVDSTLPVPQYGIASIPSGPYRVNEGASIEIPVERLDGNAGIVSITYRLTSGTATIPADVPISTGTITWTDNDSSKKFIIITATEDSTTEGPETFNLLLESATGGIEIDTAITEITIIDTTVINPGTIAFIETAGSVTEGESIEVSVARTNGSDQAVTVNIEIESDNTSELTLSPSVLTWAAGVEGTQTITVSAISDTMFEDPQTVILTLTLTESSGAQPVLNNSTYTATIVDNSPSGFIPLLATDGEWEVCVSPFQTINATAFSTQLSANTGNSVTCIKQCQANAVIDNNYPAWGWNAAQQHSCLFTSASPGTISKVPVYTPEREIFNLDLTAPVFAVSESAWVCTTGSRQNADSDYAIDTTRYSWIQFSNDGTYYYADSTDNTTLPEVLNGPETWSVNGRVLELSHVSEAYRNLIVAASAQSFQIHPDTDQRINCTLINVSVEDDQ